MSFPFDVQLTDGEEATTSATKEHRLGTKGVTEDNRVFYYMKADATYGVTNPYWTCCDSHSYKADDSEDCLEGSVVTAAVAGGFTLDSLDTTSAHVADFFADGYAALTIGSKIRLYRVKSNTAAGTSTTLTLYAPLKYTCASSGTIMIVPNIYSDVSRVHGGGDTKAATVCVANFAPITAAYYFWGQTWGPCMGTMSDAPGSTGDGTYEDRLVFSYDGSVKLEPAATTDTYNQRAGTNMMYMTDTQLNYLIFYNLEISP